MALSSSLLITQTRNFKHSSTRTCLRVKRWSTSVNRLSGPQVIFRRTRYVRFVRDMICFLGEVFADPSADLCSACSVRRLTGRSDGALACGRVDRHFLLLLLEWTWWRCWTRVAGVITLQRCRHASLSLTAIRMIYILLTLPSSPSHTHAHTHTHTRTHTRN